MTALHRALVVHKRETAANVVKSLAVSNVRLEPVLCVELCVRSKVTLITEVDDCPFA
jgi:hypothetical protein